MTTKDRTESAKAQHGVLKFRPGYVLALEFSATGGVTYRRHTEREENVGEGLEAEFRTEKRVDHVELNKTSRGVINQAYHVLDKYATHTPIGYWADAETLAKISAELVPIRQTAIEFNRVAQHLGSARRVEIQIYPLALSEEDEAAARRVARAVCDRLAALRDALKAGDRKAFELALDRAKNLHRLATGIQADSIRMAVDHAKTQKTQLLEALRQGFTPEACAPLLDMEPIEAAITLFQDPGDSLEVAA